LKTSAGTRSIALPQAPHPSARENYDALFQFLIFRPNFAFLQASGGAAANQSKSHRHAFGRPDEPGRIDRTFPGTVGQQTISFATTCIGRANFTFLCLNTQIPRVWRVPPLLY
jgi:hypothetical protein